MNGDAALAFGALHGGVSVITGYPGSPSSGTMDSLINLQGKYGFHVEWSVNEKVAAEIAIGASIGGRRSLICVKSVGMNFMLDPLMAVNLTPLNAGLVILLGDDPGGYGSQNDQDTRPMINMLELPMLEPASPEEGFIMMKEAFDLSEQFRTPIIIRETRAFSQASATFNIPPLNYNPVDYEAIQERYRFVPIPANVVEKHRDLHEQLLAFGEWTETSHFNHASKKSRKGVVASGFVYSKLIDTIGDNSDNDLSIYKLGTLFPLPNKSLADFMDSCDEVLVLEETLPFIEKALKVIAYDHSLSTKIFGKSTNHIPSEGELFRWKIAEALKRFQPDILLNTNYKEEAEASEIPKMGNPCSDCRYNEVLDILDIAAKSLGLNPLYTGDPGCLFKVGNKLTAKYAIGSAIGLASGLIKAEVDKPVVALFGDSGFFHSTIPAICNASNNRSKIMLVLLDNGAALTSGGQSTPASGFDTLGNATPKLHFNEIAKACGVGLILDTNIDDSESELEDAFKSALQFDQVSMVTVKIPTIHK